LQTKNPQIFFAGFLFTVVKQHFFCGAGRTRTAVQTHSPKAFYMLISLLFVSFTQEKNKPMQNLAV